MTIALRQRPLARVVQGIVQAGAGCWLDPSDMSTLYQDAAGTIPVTAVEQPVGLMLDKARGLMLGPEKIINGDFSTPANWTLNGASITTGRLDFNASATQYIAFQDNGLNYFAVGRSYVVELDYSTNVNANVYIDGNNAGTIPPGVGHFKCIYKALSTVNGRLQINTQAAGVGWIDNISARELYGYHATQSVTASRPVLSARKNVLLATETLATQSVTSVAAQYTLSFTGTGSVTLSGTATGTLTGTGVNDRVSLTVTPTAGTLTLTVSGSVTKAQLELGTSAGPYQRVDTATDYDTDERYFPKYLRFDGIDDYMNLPYMGLYANGSASVVLAANCISSSSDILTETSSTNGSPMYRLRQADLSSKHFVYRNDASVQVIMSATTSPTNTKRITSFVDSGSMYSIYDGSISNSSSYSRTQTTLNTTTVCARVYNGGISDSFTKMNIYGLLITKSALSDAQRIQCERLLARKAGVTL